MAGEQARRRERNVRTEERKKAAERAQDVLRAHEVAEPVIRAVWEAIHRG